MATQHLSGELGICWKRLGHGLVGDVLALQAEGPELNSENPSKNARHGDTAVTSALGDRD